MPNCDDIQLPQGPAGSPGINAFTTTVANFTQPAVSSNVSVSVLNLNQFSGSWASVGQIVFVESGGYYQVVSVAAITLVLKNLGYAGNVSPTTIVSSGAKVSPAGIVGATGAAGANGSDGSDGVDGTTLVFQNTAGENQSVTTNYTTMACTNPAVSTSSPMGVNGQSLKSEAIFSLTYPYTDNVSDNQNRSVGVQIIYDITGVPVTVSGGTYFTFESSGLSVLKPQNKITTEITRVSLTSLFIEVTIESMLESPPDISSSVMKRRKATGIFAVSDLSLKTLTIMPVVFNTVGTVIRCEKHTVEFKNIS